jgi:hypothetical protein
MQPQAFRLFAGLEVDRHSFADVPFQVAEPFSLSCQATGPGRVVPQEATSRPVSSQVLMVMVILSTGGCSADL